MRPRLIGPELIEVERVSRSAVELDPDTGEPVGPIARTARFEVLVQVDQVRENERRPTLAGPEVPTTYRCTGRRSDFDRAGWEPADGDRIVARKQRNGTDRRPCDLYVVGPDDTGKILSGRSLVQFEAVSRSARIQREGLP